MKFNIFLILSVFFYSSAFAQNYKKQNGIIALVITILGTEHIGNFINGKKHGEGTIHYYNGDKFVGEFRDGKKNGKGVFTYSSGETSSGNWQDDLYIGN